GSHARSAATVLSRAPRAPLRAAKQGRPPPDVANLRRLVVRASAGGRGVLRREPAAAQRIRRAVPAFGYLRRYSLYGYYQTDQGPRRLLQGGGLSQDPRLLPGARLS